MALITLPLCAFFLALLSYGQSETLEKNSTSDFLCTCIQIAAAISGASQVFYPPAPEYLSDISLATSLSTQESACSVEPGSAEDVGEILRILGSSRTPFAVKGGGHATNPGYSSTRGVQIAMSRFNGTKVNFKSGTVEVGPGLTWDQVYAVLEPTGINVIGGRVPGVGVAGLTLGGGYSYKTNQYGLSLDNVVGYELVLPDGTVINVTANDEDLWFGLRGGMNNFGIVTKFILKAHPQTEVWGGLISYAEDQLDAMKRALFNYQQKNDSKAAVGISLNSFSGQFVAVVLLFYDAPSPSGVFDDFLAIPATKRILSTRTFSDFVQNVGSLGEYDRPRALFDCQPVTQYSSAVVDAFVNQTKLWGARLWALDKNATVSATLEAFDKDVFSHGSASASPPDRSHAVFPSVVIIEWSDASLDETVVFALRQISEAIRAAALADGQNVSHAAKYVNYALFGTPLEDIYGGNVDRLRGIRAAIDPEGVMGLAGGWKF